MNAKDHFIEWLRDKILQNPAEPPAAAWQEISDSLDLENSWEEIEEELELDAVWQKVDSRLQQYEHLLRFEKISQGLSLLALLLLFLPLFYMPVRQEFSGKPLLREQNTRGDEKIQNDPFLGEAEFIRSPAKKKQDNALPPSSISPITNTKKQLDTGGSQKEPDTGYATGKEGGDAVGGMVGILDQEVSPAVADKVVGADSSYRNNITAAEPGLELAGNEESSVPDVMIKAVEQSGDAGDARAYELYPSAYMGLGSAVKVSSLLNSKTWHAMERSSLLSSAPSWQQDIYVVYGQRLAQRIFLQADVYLQNKAGQQYQEYRAGTYTSFRNELSYHTAALNVSWIRKQLGYGRIPMFARWTGGLYGGRLRSAEESSSLGNYERTEEYARFHAGLLAGYEYDLLLHPRLMLSYGVFGRADLMNIYSGTELIPSSFRKTGAASLDFRLTLRYSIKK